MAPPRLPTYHRTVRTEIYRGDPDDLRGDWEQLFADAVNATPFSSPGWAAAWWTVWGDSVEPWLVLADGGTGLSGLAPLVITRHRGLRVLRPLSGDLADYWDVLAAPDQLLSVSAAIAREIAARRREWDVLVLHGLRDGSAVGPALEDAGLMVREPPATVCPGIELPAGFDEYLSRLPSQRRGNLRRHLRRLDEGEMELREVEDPDEIEHVIGRWHQLRSEQWDAAGRDIYRLQRGEPFRRFMLEAARSMVPAGLLLLWEFRHRDEVAGVFVNLVDRDAFYWYLGGFDPGLARLGIGKIAIGHGIRSSVEVGRRYFDFGSGDEPYKYWYGAGDQAAAVLLAGTGSPRSRLALLTAQTARRLRKM